MREVFKKLKNVTKLLTVFAALTFMFADNANAAKQTTLAGIVNTAMCRANQTLTGTMGKAIVVVVVISSAMGMFFGKITWVTVVIIIAGIGLTFGGVSLVNSVLGGTDCSKITVADTIAS